MFNPHQTISEVLDTALENKRVRDIISRRFGLVDGQRQTLEEIGRDYGITRERVRQIEENGLELLSQPKIISKIISHLKPSFEFISEHLSEYGNLKREKRLLDDLTCICLPSEALAKEEALANEDFSRCQAALYLILVLGKPFIREKESEEFHPLWTINKKSISLARRIVDFLIRYLQKLSQTLEFEELLSQSKKIEKTLTEKALFSYIDACKKIDVNRFDQYGLINWPEISPRGVKDKAYLILKKHGQPLHFTQITELINQNNLDDKPAFIQTVHNELIKDPRFVLVGRGIYGLAEWGYEPGTVAEIISKLLSQYKALSKEEILKHVLEKRMVKENTVLINLQNRKYFIRREDGKYTLKNS